MGPFSFPDPRDLLEVLGGLSWQRERGGSLGDPPGPWGHSSNPSIWSALHRFLLAAVACRCLNPRIKFSLAQVPPAAARPAWPSGPRQVASSLLASSVSGRCCCSASTTPCCLPRPSVPAPRRSPTASPARAIRATRRLLWSPSHCCLWRQGRAGPSPASSCALPSA